MNLILNWLQQNTALAIAFATIIAVILSLISITLAFAALWLQQRHNFKSLTPIAGLPRGDYENLIDIRLRNTGVGPLIMKNFSAIKGSIHKNNLISLMPDEPAGMFWETFCSDPSDLCIPPNEEVYLIKLSGDPSDEAFNSFRDEVRQALSDIEVIVEYNDIYNRKMPIKKWCLEWFGRHINNKRINRSDSIDN